MEISTVDVEGGKENVETEHHLSVEGDDAGGEQEKGNGKVGDKDGASGEQEKGDGKVGDRDGAGGEQEKGNGKVGDKDDAGGEQEKGNGKVGDKDGASGEQEKGNGKDGGEDDAGGGQEKGDGKDKDGNSSRRSSSVTVQVQEQQRSCTTRILLTWGCALTAIILVGVVAAKKSSNYPESSPSSQNTAPHLNRRYKVNDGKLNDNGPCEVCTETANEIISSLNTSVDPCDNFYDFACQGWVKTNPAPDYWYLPDWTAVGKVEHKSVEITLEILNERINVLYDMPALVQAKEYYKSCLDMYKLENHAHHGIFHEDKTMRVIWNTLEEYGGWPILYERGKWNNSRFDMLASMADLRRRFSMGRILEFEVIQSTPEYIMDNSIMIGQPQNLPVLSAATPGKNGLRDMLAYKNFIVDVSKQLLRFKGVTDANETYLEQQAFDMLRIYTELNTAADGRENYRKSLGFPENWVYMPLGKVQSVLDQYVGSSFKNKMNLEKILELLFANTNIRINNTEEIGIDLDYLLGVSVLLSESDPETIANYLHLQLLFALSDLLPSQKFRAYNEKRLKSLGGMRSYTSQNYSVLCANEVLGIFKVALGHQYVQKRVESDFQTSTLGKEIEQVGHLFNSIKLSFGQLISSSKQIENESKLKLRESLFSARLCSGYPFWIFDKNRVQKEYSDLNLRGSNYFEQTVLLNEWTLVNNLKRLTQEAEEECMWINYVGSSRVYISNQLVYVPLGRLTVPVFHSNLPKSVLFGVMGSILGHELAHSAIENNAQNDGWLTNNEGHKTNLAKCLIEYYSSFTFDELKTENMRVNGDSTLKENFADETGLRAAYSAFKVNMYFKSGKLEGLETYTDEQLFFIVYAQHKCISNDLNRKRDYLQGETHSPPRFRTLGPLINFGEFAQAWKCPVGSKMNPKPTNNPKTCQVF